MRGAIDSLPTTGLLWGTCTSRRLLVPARQPSDWPRQSSESVAGWGNFRILRRKSSSTPRRLTSEAGAAPRVLAQESNLIVHQFNSDTLRRELHGQSILGFRNLHDCHGRGTLSAYSSLDSK